MPTNVVMPQMGESIAEGTIVRWIKKVGDNVDRDEPLFEISTDKVDAEIPSPAAGVLLDIQVKEGETVPVNSVVAVIGASTELAARAANEAKAQAVNAARSGNGGKSAKPAAPLPQAAVGQRETQEPEPEEHKEPEEPGPDSVEDLRRQKSSPLVRRIAREHNVDIRLIK